MSKISRRNFLVTASATTAATLIINGCTSTQTSSSSSSSPASPSPVAAADTPEVTTAKLGFIALTDSAPLIIAKEKGLFAKYGMPDVEVVKQASWAVTRDNIELGSGGGGIDGAHILTPMPYLITAGKITKGNAKIPMNILARLNVNGQGITLANSHADLKLGADSSPLKAVFAANKSSGQDVKCAVTFPGGTHDLWMRYWLAAGGINPDKDVSTIVVPPPEMVANIKVNTMEAFCVGEPWNAQAVNQKVGYSALTTGEMWKDHPEKALAMRADWVEANPKAAKAITMAVQEAQIWCDDLANTEEMCKIVSGRQWFKVPAEDIVERMKGNFDFGNGRTLTGSDLRMRFWGNGASYPYQSHDLWFLTENIRWGYLPKDTDTAALIKTVNREDIWQEAAKAIGQEAMIPKSTSRGVETFFDGIKFDPEKPEAYLKSLKIVKA
ncbi:MAG: ABC transporter substrate-binding protein [Pegethrix bostrychoides GSE-TBD4-15B]|uniref:ABC transporter substrate-binding protein n=1 Tax=Pegethrix bostrychoides GSE-TBD4-15B TaxID=2839662 RepID=A0A951P9S2_9CYAN|nr:ABC transporter substrate-binding protein [Pegethrix bostrychoides GSE-TBD4-15B]